MTEYHVEKYALAPYPNQERELRRWCDELRYLWNYALDERLSKPISIVEQKRSLTRWRNYDTRGLGSILSHVAQDQLQRLDDAFAASTKLGRGKPHHKREDELTSFTHPDGDGSFRIDQTGRNGTWRLHLSGGQHGEDMDIPVVVHRPLPPNGVLGPVTVERHIDRWFVVLTYKIADVVPPTGMPERSIGIDAGLTHLLTMSDGSYIDPPKFYRRSEKRLAREQRKLSRRKKWSNNRKKQALKVALLQYKIARQRRDFTHKLTTELVRQYDGIGVEDLSLGFMLRNRSTAKSASDASLGQLVQMFEYKERRRSGRFIKVDARNTTQECSRCGSMAERVGRSDRIRSCSVCGLVMDRDQNAAINIRSRFIAEVTLRTLGEVTPVKRTLPLKQRKGRRSPAALQACSSKQEPPCAASIFGPTGPSGPMLEGL